MKTILSPICGAAIALALASQPALAAKKKEEAPVAAAPAAPAGAPIVPGLAVASIEWVAGNSDAKRAADTQRPITYKVQYDALTSYRNQLTAQLKPLYEKIDRDSKTLPKTPANQALLQQQADAIQQIEQQGEARLNQLAQPIAYSQAYVDEQIEEKMGDAMRNAMNAKNISIVLSPQAVGAYNGAGYNLNPTILVELNKLIPVANLSPPQGWEPRQIREARAAQARQQAAAQGQPPAATPAPAPAAQPPRPAGPQPEGR